MTTTKQNDLLNRLTAFTMAILRLNDEMKVTVLLAGFWCALLLSSCTPAKKKAEKSDEYNETKIHLYHQYLDGDVNTARRSLQQWLRLAETNKSDAQKYAFDLSMIYPRLYVLETSMGDRQTASNYFEEAIKWRIEEDRLVNMDPSDIEVDKAACTPEAITDLVLEWDKRSHAGRGPAYLH